jgi:hypothetical protein
VIDGPRFLSAPYDWLVWPALPCLLGALAGVCLAGIVADLTQPATHQGRGRLASLCIAILSFTIGRGWFAFDSWASAAFVVTAYGVLIAHAARYGWSVFEVSPATTSRWWIGVVIVVTAFALKCVRLEDWPANLNTYAAMTGEEGLRALAGEWPERFFGVRAYPLAEGGQSPLHLPLLWAAMILFGGTVFAVRFVEVVGSTVLLGVFWIWLRRVLPGPWATVALAVFAFSPWHLAQSRFGSFFSSSVALALAILWLSERALRRSRRSSAAWLVLGLCAGAIGWLYAPLQVLYAFVALTIAGGLLRGGRRLQPLIAVGAVALVLGIQLTQSGIEGFLRSDFGQLATDTVIWRKSTADIVSTGTQPLKVVVDNFARNVEQWYRETFREPAILVWYAPALGIGFLYALADLWRQPARVRALYYLIGMLPPLLIFPLHRRSLIIWPLVYVAGVRFCREVVCAAAAVRWQPWSRRAAAAAVAVFLAASSLHGLQQFAIANPAGLVLPYFGPPFRYRMIDEAKALLPYYHLLFVNPSIIKHAIHIGMYEPGRATKRSEPYRMVEIQQGEVGLERLLRRGQQNCFIYLNDEEHRWVAEALMAALPNGRLIERRDRGDGPPLYTLYLVSAE